MSISKANRTSADLTAEQLTALRRVLPEVFAENKIDWNLLRKALGEHVETSIERFGLTWPGKTAAIRSVLAPSALTLRPEKGESIDFDTTENLFIEGDNLEVLKLLQKAYFSKVKMIYIDPPYNTGGDFVYHDDFAAPLDNYLKQTGQKDGNGHGLTTNRETNGRYHSDWLSMMYPRLKLAWNLLRQDGVIFVSIDDNEVADLRLIMNEIFGEENFVSQIVWEKMYTTKNDAKTISNSHEYVLFYTRSISNFAVGLLPRTEEMDARYTNPDSDPRGPWKSIPMYSKGATKSGAYKITSPSNKVFVPPPDSHWRYTQETTLSLIEDNRLYFGADGVSQPSLKRFLTEVQDGLIARSLWSHEDVGTNDSAKREMKALFGESIPFEFPKPTTLIRRMLALANDDKAIVLDFFAGSGTTAHAVMAQNVEDGGNRKWINVQLPEPTPEDSAARKAGYTTIADIAKERIRRAAKKVAAEDEKKQSLDYGFKVFKLDRSNYVENNFEYDPAKSEAENAQAFTEYLARADQQGLFPKVRDLDVVYENIVKEGLSLNAKVSEEHIGSCKAYRVEDGDRELLVCLEREISPDTVKTLTTPAYKGKTFICLDTALDDTAKANLGLALELKTI